MLFLSVLRITPSLQHSCHFRNTAVFYTGLLPLSFPQFTAGGKREKLSSSLTSQASEELSLVMLLVKRIGPIEI
jgi:hypothetical protein